MKQEIIAVDFDGTLCSTAYPGIGKRHLIHKIVAAYIRYKKKHGCIIVLNTLRDKHNKEQGPEPLNRAVEACKSWNIPIDYVNDNPRRLTEEWGYSRKIAADRFLDDRNVGMLGWLLRACSKTGYKHDK